MPFLKTIGVFATLVLCLNPAGVIAVCFLAWKGVFLLLLVAGGGVGADGGTSGSVSSDTFFLFLGPVMGALKSSGFFFIPGPGSGSGDFLFTGPLLVAALFLCSAANFLLLGTVLVSPDSFWVSFF